MSSAGNSGKIDSGMYSWVSRRVGRLACVKKKNHLAITPMGALPDRVMGVTMVRKRRRAVFERRKKPVHQRLCVGTTRRDIGNQNMSRWGVAHDETWRSLSKNGIRECMATKERCIENM